MFPHVPNGKPQSIVKRRHPDVFRHRVRWRNGETASRAAQRALGGTGSAQQLAALVISSFICMYIYIYIHDFMARNIYIYLYTYG